MDKKAVDGFLEIVRNTLCPYASSAQVIFGPAWEAELPFEDNIKNNAGSLSQFCHRAFANRLHGFAMEIIAGEKATQFEAVKHLFYSALKELNKHDPDLSNCMSADYTQIGWQFEFGGIRLFVNVFAPCYPERHTKYSYSKERMFIFFQPVFSFDFCGINRTNKKAKEYIRQLFCSANRSYNGDLIDDRIEAFLYMFPMATDDPPVRWWE